MISLVKKNFVYLALGQGIILAVTFLFFPKIFFDNAKTILNFYSLVSFIFFGAFIGFGLIAWKVSGMGGKQI